MCSPIVISSGCVQWVSERPFTSSGMSAASLTIFSAFPGLFIPLTFQVPTRNVVCNISCWLLLVRPVAYFTCGAWMATEASRVGWLIHRRYTVHGRVCSQVGYRRWSWVDCRPVRLFWRPSLAMTKERYKRLWYFKERRIPPLLPPHPSSLAVAVHDCLFSIYIHSYPSFLGDVRLSATCRRAG